MRVDWPGSRGYEAGMDLVLSLVMLAAAGLAVGAVWQWRRGARRQATLLGVLVVVMVVNVLIWPKSGGTAASSRAAEGGPGN